MVGASQENSMGFLILSFLEHSLEQQSLAWHLSWHSSGGHCTWREKELHSVRQAEGQLESKKTMAFLI